MDKRDIRKQIFARRRELSGEELEQKSLAVCRRILALPVFSEAETVYVYMGCKGEVRTQPLIEEAWRLGKRVAAPRVQGEDMAYYYIRSFCDVKPGYFGIPEPEPAAPAAEEEALLLVPGVGFDENRHRCGYGKGFYDRYLAAHPRHVTVAAAFEFQIVAEVPAEPFDIFPQYLVTEERVITAPSL